MQVQYLVLVMLEVMKVKIQYGVIQGILLLLLLVVMVVGHHQTHNLIMQEVLEDLREEVETRVVLTMDVLHVKVQRITQVMLMQSHLLMGGVMMEEV